MKCRAGPCARRAAPIHLEKDKAYKMLGRVLALAGHRWRRRAWWTRRARLWRSDGRGSSVRAGRRWRRLWPRWPGRRTDLRRHAGSPGRHRCALGGSQRRSAVPARLDQAHRRRICRPTQPDRASTAKPLIWPGRPTPWCWSWALTVRRKAKGVTATPSNFRRCRKASSGP